MGGGGGGYMTKNPCHVLAIVIRIFSYWLGNPKLLLLILYFISL